MGFWQVGLTAVIEHLYINQLTAKVQQQVFKIPTFAKRQNVSGNHIYI